MQELISKLIDLAMHYEDIAYKEQDEYRQTWLRGIALGLRRAVCVLEEVT